MKARKNLCKQIRIYNPNAAAQLAVILQAKEGDRV